MPKNVPPRPSRIETVAVPPDLMNLRKGSRAARSDGHSPDAMHLEDDATCGGLDRIFLDLIQTSHEPPRDPVSVHVRIENVPEESDSLCAIELGRGHLLGATPARKRRTTGGAQVARPVDLTPRADQPQATGDLGNGDRC